METRPTFEELQAKMNEIADVEHNPVFNFFSVSPNDEIEEVLCFDNDNITSNTFITDWEL